MPTRLKQIFKYLRIKIIYDITYIYNAIIIDVQFSNINLINLNFDIILSYKPYIHILCPRKFKLRNIITVVIVIPSIRITIQIKDYVLILLFCINGYLLCVGIYFCI